MMRTRETSGDGAEGPESERRRPHGSGEVIDVYDRDGSYDPYDEQPPPQTTAPPRRGGVRRVSPAARLASYLGEVLITFGLVIALFLAYELWWTDLTARREARHNISVLEQQWRSTPGSVTATGPSTAFKAGEGFALLYVPRFGQGWRVEVMQGISEPDVLDKGAAGHYPQSAMPWQSHGNFAVAGHRDTYGSIFHNLNQLHAGDLVYVQTATEWYTYRIDKGLPQTSKYNVSVIYPIPEDEGAPVYRSSGRYITLTTCTPVYTSNYRLIWWGHLVAQQSARSGVPTSLANSL